jgi:outer membrane protein TolC
MEKAASAADAAAGRTEQGNALGHIDLADLLYARRQARETRRAEIEARAEAHRAITRLRIDAHALWLDEHVQ